MAESRQRNHARVAIVVSRYNGSITDRLLRGALDAYGEVRTGEPAPTVIPTPGVFELAPLAAAAARTGRFDGIVALGCVIKGETDHDTYIAHAAARGLTDVGVHLGVPATFGVLTVDNPEQASARAGGAKGNKGHEAMTALLDVLAAAESLRAGRDAREGLARADKAAAQVGRRA